MSCVTYGDLDFITFPELKLCNDSCWKPYGKAVTHLETGMASSINRLIAGMFIKL